MYEKLILAEGRALMCMSIFFNQPICIIIIEEIEERYDAFHLLNNKRLNKTTIIILSITKHDNLQELEISKMQNTTPSKTNSGS
jgi:hypothetical protein